MGTKTRHLPNHAHGAAHKRLVAVSVGRNEVEKHKDRLNVRPQDLGCRLSA
jgi:hypothetical protein